MNPAFNLESFIKGIPKAELHLHIEGTFEPELMFLIADRNNLPLPYPDVSAARAAYNFNNLQEFLNLYYQGVSVMKTEEDFYLLTLEYFTKVSKDNVVHAEIFFDPQTHTNRGIEFATVIKGIRRAQEEAVKKFGITSNLILSFLRDLSEQSAFETLEHSLPFKDWITGVGLDSAEMGNPPSKFKNVFSKAKSLGFHLMAHAGEEGPPEYVREALDFLKVERIDHGNRSLEDDKLVSELVERQIPLTLCPLSNLKLCVITDLKEHPVKQMLGRGLKVTLNSDDPAYFGGYINQNFIRTAGAVKLTADDIIRLVKNSFEASFIPGELKTKYIEMVDDFVTSFDSQVPDSI